MLMPAIDSRCLATQTTPHQALGLCGSCVLVTLQRAQLLVDIRVHEVGDVVPAPYLGEHVVPLVLQHPRATA